jgi:hypothetical protein
MHNVSFDALCCVFAQAQNLKKKKIKIGEKNEML